MRSSPAATAVPERHTFIPPPWIIIGAVLVLVPLLTAMTVVNLDRQREIGTRMLLEKGAALIRAFEAGTRTAMRMRGGDFKLQHLLEETARQPDIVYLAVVGLDGRVLAHSHPEAIGVIYGTEVDLAALVRDDSLHWRRTDASPGGPVLEVYRRFTPIGSSRPHGRMHARHQPAVGGSVPGPRPETPARAIFVGLDMTAVQTARRNDVRHAVVMAAVMLLIGFAGIVLLFAGQRFRQTRSRLHRLQAEMARNQRLVTVGRLAAGVAHEIRNPLSSLKGFATYFRDRTGAAEADRQTAGIMIQEVERLNRVVGQLLEFSRPVTVVRRVTPVAPFVEDTLRLLERPAAAAGVTIQRKITPPDLAFAFDPDRVRQVLLNLGFNGIEAMTGGGRLWLAAGALRGGLVFTVSDTGCGIPAHQLNDVFDPYFTTRTSGTGLGLAIVHNIVEAHGGHVAISSRVGRGTRITVTIPPEGGAAVGSTETTPRRPA